MLLKQSAVALAATLSLASASSSPAPTLPVTGGSHELAAPPAGLQLKYIALGVGVQNYTCATVNGSPVATGALAMLYDLTSYYPGQSAHSYSKDVFNALPSIANHEHDERLNFDPNLPNRLPAAHEGVSPTNPFGPDAPLRFKGWRDCFPFLGHHYFDAAGTPTFVLAGGAVQLHAQKVDSTSPPAGSDPGAGKTGAVQWLELNDKGGSVGATYVYRVMTVGGNSHNCSSGTGGDTTTYSAYYWFYG